ncbi:MAG: dihydroneopterin aldolase [Chloroflexota bacterium]|nr:dihydroneopterin aldolase [Chloroflexota bacterium]
MHDLERRSDAIVLSGLAFYAYHGARPEERALGQRFVVDARLELDLGPAGRSDDLALTVNYADVWLAIREAVEGPPLNLIEAVAERVATAVLDRFASVEAIWVRVFKPSAPVVGAPAGDIAVELWRRRRPGGSGG